ncbi:MAG: MBL fold metallo-hydrolase [Thermovirgaceae bacterium]
MPDKRTSLIFLGTGGSRFTIMHQLRASGGLWLDWKGFPVAIDPGPGSLVRMRQHNPPLDPGTLEAILVTHRHLDHTTDLNVLTEAMTGGGFKKRGTVLLPSDTPEDGEPVLYKYLQAKIYCLDTWQKDSPSELA